MTTTTSPDLTAMRTGLRTWFAALVGLEPAAVQWEDEPRSMHVGSCGLLNVIAERIVGQDERQRRYNALAPAGQEIERKVGGPRIMTLSLKLDGYDQRLPEGPLFRMSSAAAKARGVDSISQLRAMGLALIDIVGPTNAPRIEDNRIYPRAVLDVRLGYTRVESEAPTTWIEKVRVKSRFRDVDGAELPSPPNGTIEIGGSE